jgi:hypothetical protein
MPGGIHKENILKDYESVAFKATLFSSGSGMVMASADAGEAGKHQQPF